MRFQRIHGTSRVSCRIQSSSKSLWSACMLVLGGYTLCRFHIYTVDEEDPEMALRGLCWTIQASVTTKPLKPSSDLKTSVRSQRLPVAGTPAHAHECLSSTKCHKQWARQKVIVNAKKVVHPCPSCLPLYQKSTSVTEGWQYKCLCTDNSDGFCSIKAGMFKHLRCIKGRFPFRFASTYCQNNMFIYV